MSYIMSSFSHRWATSSQPLGTYRHLRNGTSNSSTTTRTGFFSYLKSLSPRGVIEYRKYENVLLGANESKERGKFLRACKEEQVLPPSIAVSDNVLELPFPPTHRHALVDRITVNRRDTGSRFHEARIARRRYQQHFPAELRVQLHSIVKRTVDGKMANHKLHLQRKLTDLCNSSLWNCKSLKDSVVNLSSSAITEDQITFLGYGLSMNQKATNSSLVASLSNVFQSTHGTSHPEAVKGALVHGFLNLMQDSPTMPRRLQVASTDLKRNPDIRVMPADKGSRVVILDTVEYIAAGNLLLSDTNVYKKLTCRDNPLNY